MSFMECPLLLLLIWGGVWKTLGGQPTLVAPPEPAGSRIPTALTTVLRRNRERAWGAVQAHMRGPAVQKCMLSTVTQIRCPSCRLTFLPGLDVLLPPGPSPFPVVPTSEARGLELRPPTPTPRGPVQQVQDGVSRSCRLRCFSPAPPATQPYELTDQEPPAPSPVKWS